ncbi:MAG: HlyD family efflux transporter periplasmic adaptor subunit, partial [Phycisphaerae bacterium]|nr:HlyD family efflux transporter periplasmic adaptor subunit [Phycisphaerae bacterium]
VVAVAAAWSTFRGDDKPAVGPATPLSGGPTSSVQRKPLTGGELYETQRGDFDMIIPVSGALVAARQIEVRNKMEGRAVITEIVPEGRTVKQGDTLLRLSEEELLNKIKDAEDKAKTEESAVIAAEQSLAIRENQKQSEVEKADLAVQLAELALEAWDKGEVVSKRETLKTALETAQIDKERLDRRFEEASALVEKGYISRDDFEKDRMNKITGDAKVKQCELDIQVYELYQYKQDRAKKESDLDQARAERGRTEQRADAELTKLRADLESTRFKSLSAKDRLNQLNQQLSYCTVIAPTDGLVVYATSIEGSGGMGGRGGGDVQPPQVGTELKANELVIILPDVSAMMANLKVNESLSGRVKKGQPVTIWSDAMPNTPVQGTVQGVSVLAETGGWRDPNRRDYTVKVALEANPRLGLKPSMRCKGEIVLDRVTDAVSVPIQAIFRQGPTAYVYVPVRGGYAPREVKLGRASELEVEIINGLDEGVAVLLREPRTDEIIK